MLVFIFLKKKNRFKLWPFPPPVQVQILVSSLVIFLNSYIFQMELINLKINRSISNYIYFLKYLHKTNVNEEKFQITIKINASIKLKIRWSLLTWALCVFSLATTWQILSLCCNTIYVRNMLLKLRLFRCKIFAEKYFHILQCLFCCNLFGQK